MRKIGLLLIVIALLVSACGGEPAATPTTLPPTAIQPLPPAATPASSAAEHIERGEAYVDQDELDKAAVEFQAALDLEPDNATAHNDLGAVYVEQGQFDQAVTALQEAIKLDPTNAFAHANLCHAYTELGQFGEALTECQKAIDLDRSSATAHNILGILYYEQNNLDEAEREFKEAVKLDHEYGLAHNNLGNVYNAKGKYDDAVFELKEAIRIDPSDPLSHNGLGNSYQNLKQFEEAITEYQEAIRLDPSYASPHQNLGILYETQGRTDEAVTEFQTYLQLEPNSAQRAAVEAEIAKLQGTQTTLTAEYTDPLGGYSVRYPAEWGVFQDKDDEPTLVFLAPGGSNPNPTFVIIARPLSYYEHELDVDEITTLEQFAAAAGPAFEVDPQTLTSGTVAGVPAFFGGWRESSQGQEMTGQIALFVARGMGYAIGRAATSSAQAAFEPIGTAMLDSFTLVEPQVTAEYTNQAAGYSLRYPDGWVVTEEDTFVGLTPLADLQPNDSPYVALFAGQDQIVEAFQVEGEFNTDNIIAGFVKATNAQSERLDPGTVGGQVAAAVEVALEVDGERVEGLVVIFEQAEPPLVVLLLAPASQGVSFAEPFSQILTSLTFDQPAAAGGVDQTDPAKVVQAVFTAAQTQSFTTLSGLCDPQGENDKDTATICTMTAGHADEDSFVTYFATGKISGEVTVSGDRAQVPFLFGPNGDQAETMSLIRRDGKWYLLEF